MSAATRRVVSQPTKSTYIGHSVKTIAGKPGEPLRKVKATEEIATARSSSCPAAQHPSMAIAQPAVPQTALRADPRSYYRSPTYYTPPTRPSWSAGGGSSSGGSSSGGSSGGGSSGGGKSRRVRGGGSVSYSAAEWRTIEPLARQAEEQAREDPERRDLFLCHAWDDRQGAARELCDLLVSLGATVWFSEKDVGLGKSLLCEIDRGLANSRIGIVLVTPALLKSLAA